MTQRIGLIVTDASPLITLAAGAALECLTMPGVPVAIPDMVYFEVTRDYAKLGAGEVVQWARRHRDQVQIMPTFVFAEFQALRTVNPNSKSSGRGEFSALEVLNAAIADDFDLKAVLLFEDSDVRKRRFLRGLPERVLALSTGDLLLELEAAARIQSRDHILDVAAAKECNVAKLREPEPGEEARMALRNVITRGS